METRVSQVLDRKGWDVHSIGPNQTVYDAIEKMEDLGIGALVVVDDEELVGIITERDYLQKIALEGRSSSETPVSTIMTDEVVCIGPTNTVRQCMTLMSEIRARHLPVMTDDELQGIISIGDCVRQLTLDQEFEIQKLKEFITSKYPA
jgi:CBS domain-containing protein